MATLMATHETTEQDVVELLGGIARAKVRIMRAEAKREAQVQRAKAACDEETEEDRAAVVQAEERITQYILAHRDQFKRPRMHACIWGQYGLRSSDRTEIADADACIRWLRENGYGDLVKTTETPVAKGVAKLIREGQPVAGATVVPGELVKYELDATVLKSLE